MAEDEEERADPEFRYDLHGSYDVDSYYDDLEGFPSYFDDNGWPLFGRYDRDALVHPITGLPWYENPREPDEDDNIHYLIWCMLAASFQTLALNVYTEHVKPKKEFEEKVFGEDNIPDRERDHTFYRQLKYLREDLYPRLKEMFAERIAGLEFAEAWGEFNLLTGSMGLSSFKEEISQMHKLGKQRGKDRTLHWYLLMEKKFKDQGKSAAALNNFIKRTIFPLVENSDSKLPPNYRKILAMLFRREKDDKKIVLREIADYITRRNKDPQRVARLLNTKYPEGGACPPLSTEFFTKLRKFCR